MFKHVQVYLSSGFELVTYMLHEVHAGGRFVSGRRPGGDVDGVTAAVVQTADEAVEHAALRPAPQALEGAAAQVRGR